MGLPRSLSCIYTGMAAPVSLPPASDEPVSCVSISTFGSPPELPPPPLSSSAALLSPG